MTGRDDGWPLRLHALIDQCRDRPFQWGRFDCLIFANAACRAIRGTGFADDWLRRYADVRGAARACHAARRAEATDDLTALIDARLRPLPPNFPPRGAIAARRGGQVLGWTLGVALDRVVAFPGRPGLIFDAPGPGDRFWSVT